MIRTIIGDFNDSPVSVEGRGYLAQDATGWLTKRWNRYDGKHRVHRLTKWKDAVEATKWDAAVYRPAMTDKEQESLEIGCIRDENFLKERGVKRAYWMDTGSMIGASNGEETTYIYVEHRREGDVHGRPMTRDQLKKFGAPL